MIMIPDNEPETTNEPIAPETPGGFLDDAVRAIQASVEQKFLFRKIGLPFDYASNPDDFPSRAFATAKEARSNLPNPSGLGGGFFHSCRNHALLFDAYLLRLELGIEAPGDEAILDRLIGGLIRLATIAPKSFLVGGLAPDGRGFYAQPGIHNHAAWAFAMNRGVETAAISPESQDKFRSISGKWIDRVKREKYRLCGIDGKPFPDADLSRAEPDTGPFLLAMLLAAARASGDDKDYELYAGLAAEESAARTAAFEPQDSDDMVEDLLWRQCAWSLIAERDPDPDRVETAKKRLHENALAASRHVSAWREWKPDLIDTPVDLDWRQFPKAPLDESPFGFTPPDSWERMRRERVIAETMSAAFVMLLAGDPELMEIHVPEITDCLSGIPWESLTTLTALAPAIAVHARGVEMGLWDKTLFETRRESPSSETSFAAKYMEADYDDENPEKAGHNNPPPGKKRKAERERGGGGGGDRSGGKQGEGGSGQQGGAKKRRRRRRK